MNYYEVVPLVVIHGSEAGLTYEYADELAVGTLVVVPVGRKGDVSGVITSKVRKPKFATKSIKNIIEPTALPRPLLNLASWLSEFYVTHPVPVWQTILPRGLTKSRRGHQSDSIYAERKKSHYTLNPDQKKAVETIIDSPPATHLLHGVTGSGKTAVYIEVAKQVVKDGKSVIVLVPEIALTSQLIAEFTPHFSDVTVTHSTMTEAERHRTWQKLLRSTSPQVVIGPRSALFSPLKNLGLIVIDECHEMTFKQEQSPRYSALRAAAMLARFSGARLVLGSATPSIADYYLAKSTGQSIIRLASPARKDVITPVVKLIDMTKREQFSRHQFLSNQLIKTLSETLEAGHQALIFHNRRGTAPSTMCESCGWQALCGRCFVPMTLHADQFLLRCHICNTTSRVPTSCPVCNNASVTHKGIGTKLIHQEIAKIFPNTSIARFDGDTDTDQTLDKKYQELYDGDIDVIIGTQVVAKGLDLPKLRSVAVVQADAGLMLPDFGSSERTFQLLAQASGRVGRNEYPSSVIVQSYQPLHPAVVAGISANYQEFYEATLAERDKAHFPPFRHLLKLICIYKSESAASSNAAKLLRQLKSSSATSVEFLGPAPAFYERVRDSYRWQIVARSPVRSDLIKLLDQLPPTHWQFELDPSSLL